MGWSYSCGCWLGHEGQNPHCPYQKLKYSHSIYRQLLLGWRLDSLNIKSRKRLCPLVLQPQMGPLHHPLKTLVDGALIESLIGKEETTLGEKPAVILPFCCTIVSKVRKWNLYTSAMAQPKVLDNVPNTPNNNSCSLHTSSPSMKRTEGTAVTASAMKSGRCPPRMLGRDPILAWIHCWQWPPLI